MMNVVVLAHRGIDALLVETALEGGFEAEVSGSAQEMCSALYRDPHAIGVIWSDSAYLAATTCRDWRHAGMTNLLFVLLKPDPEIERAAELRCLSLMAGADDVQPVPIDRIEFIARLSALARRARDLRPSAIKMPNDALYYPERGVVEFPGGAVMLSKQENALLELLTMRPEQVVTKEMVVNHLYGGRDEPELKIVDVFVCKIRKKLTLALNGTDVIRTVWGRGYQFISEGFAPVLGDARVRVSG